MKKKSKTVNSAKLTIPSLSVNESLSRSFIAAFMMQLNPTVGEVSDMKCAVSEAVTNSIIHAYEGKVGIITVKAALSPDRVLTVEISDRGCGIENIEKALQPLYTTNTDGDRSGMGFTVMETFTDKIKVTSKYGKGTKVKLIKKISE